MVKKPACKEVKLAANCTNPKATVNAPADPFIKKFEMVAPLNLLFLNKLKSIKEFSFPFSIFKNIKNIIRPNKARPKVIGLSHPHVEP